MQLRLEPFGALCPGAYRFRSRVWIISELSSLLLKLRRSIRLVELILSYRQDQTAYLRIIMSMYVSHKILAYLVDE